MELMQRLGSSMVTDAQYIDGYIEEAKKYPGSYDNIWLPTHYGFPKMKKHKELAQYYVHVAEKFRENGISVSLQLSNSIGHGKYMSKRDCSGLVYDGSPAEKLVGHDGTVADYCFCWRGEYFRKYILEELSYYAWIKPDCVWVDDDFRANNHNPVSFGCFCEQCMEKFNRLYQSNFSRAQLVEEILHGELRWRERYVMFVRQGMYDLMYEMGKAIHQISPDTAMGYQYCANGAYTGYGFDYIFDAMKEATGHPPKSRPGGGVYNDHNPNEILKKAVLLNWQNTMLPSYVDCKCPEIENLPFVAFGKTPEGTAFETTYYFANGNTDMSYSMIMNMNETMEWHDREFELMAQNRKYWEKLAWYNKNSFQAGLQYFMSKEIWKKKLDSNENIWDLNKEHHDEFVPLLRTAIPIALDKEDDTLILLHPETAKVLSDTEIAYLLSRNVVTDGESIDILRARGVDLGLRSTKLEEEQILRISEKMTSHKVNPPALKTWTSSYFTEGRKNCYYLEKLQNDIEVVGIYKSDVDLPFFTADEEFPYGIAEAIVTTSQGGRWAVLAYCPWKGIISYARREQLLNMADDISNNGLCARLLTPVQAVLLPRKNRQGKTVCVSVTNCTIGDSGMLELLIRNPIGEIFSFMTQGKEEIVLEFEKREEDYIVKVPGIASWTTGTVFIQ